MGILNIEENNSNDLKKKNHVPQINIIFYKKWVVVGSFDQTKIKEPKMLPTTINIKIAKKLFKYNNCKKKILFIE